MIHSMRILSVLYRIPKYLLFFEHYYHCNIYDIMLIILHCTDGASCCPFFVIRNTFVIRKNVKTATIHGCCLIIFYTPPTIQANIASSWSTYTKVSALYWYLYYFGLVYRINLILRLIQGDFFIVLHFVKRFMWDHSVFN